MNAPFRRVSLAQLKRDALLLAQDGEDADTIAGALRGSYPQAREADIWTAADHAIAHRYRRAS